MVNPILPHEIVQAFQPLYSVALYAVTYLLGHRARLSWEAIGEGCWKDPSYQLAENANSEKSPQEQEDNKRLYVSHLQSILVSALLAAGTSQFALAWLLLFLGAKAFKTSLNSLKGFHDSANTPFDCTSSDVRAMMMSCKTGSTQYTISNITLFWVSKNLALCRQYPP